MFLRLKLLCFAISELQKLVQIVSALWGIRSHGMYVLRH
jgi:hypothetical protein